VEQQALGAVEVDLRILGRGVRRLHQVARGLVEPALGPGDHPGEVEHANMVLAADPRRLLEGVLRGVQVVVIDGREPAVDDRIQ